MKHLLQIPLFLVLGGAGSLALAAPIEVNNHSFERPPLDSGAWTNALPDPDNVDGGPDWIGQNGPSDGKTFIEFIEGFNSEGDQHLGMQGNYYVFQNTGTPWEANSTYTLTVGVGNRNQSPGALAIIGLTNLEEDPSPDNRLEHGNANDQWENDPWLSVASLTVDLGEDEQLSFTDYTLVFSTSDAIPAGNVVIFLGDEGTAQRSHFDNVRLDVQPNEGGGEVPDGCGGFAGLDPDGDGIVTPIEEKHGLDPCVADADSDADGDGLGAKAEIFDHQTLVDNADTDGDGLSDGVEVNDAGTDPTEPDTDRDGLTDGVETNTGIYVSAEDTGTDPLVADTDEDGTSDGKEVAAGTNPMDPADAPAFPIPIAYWPFDDRGATETEDLGPQSIVSQVNGDPEWVTGHTGEANDFAIKFDGEDDSVTTDVSLLNNLAELTMSFWVRMEEEQLGNRIGLVGQNDAVEYGMINPTTMQWWSPAGSINVPFGPTVEEWTHVAVVLDTEGFTVYANGEEIGSAEGGGPVESGDTLNIGGDGVFDNSGNFFLGEIDDVALWDEPLSAEDIAALAAGEICPLGACAGSDFTVTEVTRAADGVIDLSWSSAPGRFYDVEASADLSSGSWASILTAISAAGEPAVETSASLQSDLEAPMNYYRVVQVPPPPFLEAGFENGAGDWTVSLFPGGTESGTTWEFGTPTNGPGAARTGSGVAATGLTADYADNTTVQLRSPVIDTAGVTGVSLSFWYFLEALEGEGGRVNVLEANGDLIQSLEPLFTGGDIEEGNSDDWTEISIRLPKLEPVRPFIIEFQFLSSGGGDPSNGAGWFIDDVRVAK